MTTSQHAAVRLLAQRILEIGYEDLPARERHVIERVANRLAVSRDINVDYDEGLTFGQRLSDRIAAFGGSWSFIMIFGAAIAAHHTDASGPCERPCRRVSRMFRRPCLTSRT